MNLLIAIGVFLLPVLSGGMLIHLLWPERDIKILCFKAFLGIGIGLGISSLLYFLYLYAFASRHWFIFVQLAIFLILLIMAILGERKRGKLFLPHLNLTRAQAIFSVIAGVILIVSLLSAASYLLRRKQGDWDAWMMFNRSARFIYRDEAHWLESFSRQMDPIFHADYPLLLAMNIVSGWDTMGYETTYAPMIQSAFFAIACLGLAISALASLKSTGQAALGLIILWGTPTLVNEGARQLADVPLAFFMLSTVVLICFFSVYKNPQLIALAGLTAGLAAWTKNEGDLFIIAAGFALAVMFFKEKSLRLLSWYILGLVFPLAVVMYFKLFIAPPSDIFNDSIHFVQKILDISRHVEIINFWGGKFLTFGGWTVGILPVLLVYLLFFRSRIDQKYRNAYLAGILILTLQMLGNYTIYLITPYPLEWHLSYSFDRIITQIYPIIVFLTLCATQTPEIVFEGSSTGAKYASHH